jgi:hypothetical protein
MADEPTAFAIHPRAITSEELMQAVKEMRRTRPPRGEDMSSINALLKEIIEQTRKPLSCDLTADPLACAILRQWARQPWQEAHRAALIDRMLQLGCSETEVCWSRMFAPGWLASVRVIFRDLPRRAVRRWLKPWRAKLIEQFGDFELNTLP